jgi:tetratricopeptide (TPR) repeat protein
VTCAFAHPLLGSALYQALGQSERQRVHEKLSQVLEDPLDRARHLALSTDEPDRAVAAALEEAASLAGWRGAPSAAGELGEHAFRRTPAAEVADACRRALAAAHAYLAAGEVARARMVAHELESCVPGSSAHADVLLLRTELEPGNLQGRIAARREALRDPALEPDQRLLVHQKLALMLRFTESLDVAQEHARVAVELAEELGDDASLGGSLGALALLRFTAGEPDALELAERGYALARRAGRPQAVIEAGMCLSHILTWSVELGRARALLEQLVALWSERDERFVSQALWYLALVELRAGRPDVAAEHAERSRELSLLYGPDDTEDPQDLFAAALVAAHRGQLEGARDLVEAACRSPSSSAPCCRALMRRSVSSPCGAESRRLRSSASARPNGLRAQRVGWTPRGASGAATMPRRFSRSAGARTLSASSMPGKRPAPDSGWSGCSPRRLAAAASWRPAAETSTMRDASSRLPRRNTNVWATVSVARGRCSRSVSCCAAPVKSVLRARR